MSKKNQLRIIGGQWRGRKLNIADVDGLRPTGDRIRETLFNWLMSDIVDSHCLDLFAGSGALGLESLSRGAASVTLLEKNRLAANQLEQHCQQLQTNKAVVIKGDSLHWLRDNTLAKHSIDIAFIDPPFAADLWQASIEQLDESSLLAPNALIYIEAPKNKELVIKPNWKIIKEKISGDICYRLYTKD